MKKLYRVTWDRPQYDGNPSMNFAWSADKDIVEKHYNEKYPDLIWIEITEVGADIAATVESGAKRKGIPIKEVFA